MVLLLRVDNKRFLYVRRNPASNRFYAQIRLSPNKQVCTDLIRGLGGKIVLCNNVPEVRYYLTRDSNQDLSRIRDLLKICQT